MIEIDAQKDRSVSVPVEVFVVAAPVASTSVWGETPPGSLCVAPGAKNYDGFETYAGLGGFTSGSIMQMRLGDERYIPFQSCDIDGIPVQHSLPSSPTSGASPRG